MAAGLRSGDTLVATLDALVAGIGAGRGGLGRDGVVSPCSRCFLRGLKASIALMEGLP